MPITPEDIRAAAEACARVERQIARQRAADALHDKAVKAAKEGKEGKEGKGGKGR